MILDSVYVCKSDEDKPDSYGKRTAVFQAEDYASLGALSFDYFYAPDVPGGYHFPKLEPGKKYRVTVEEVTK
jgi:hypothetical protein